MKNGLRLQQQMTFDIGDLAAEELPVAGKFTIGGQLRAIDELKKNAVVHIQISDADGVVVATGSGLVNSIEFVNYGKDEVRWTERRHKIRMSK